MARSEYCSCGLFYNRCSNDIPRHLPLERPPLHSLVRRNRCFTSETGFVMRNYNAPMYLFPASEERAYQRRQFAFDAKVLIDDVGPYSVMTVNMSRSGLSLLSQRPLDIGRNYAIAIDVPDSPRRINAWGTVVCCDSTPDGFHAGVRFLDMDAYSSACIDDLLTSHEEVR